MNMTFKNYILNPMGKNNAVMNANAREIMRKTYKNKFDNVLLRENGVIKYFCYKDSKNNTYWLHIKVPSEVVAKFYYDVVLKFSADQTIKNNGTDLFDYNVQFYSNDPAFVFTYAHVFLKNNLFIRELSSKMSKEALRHEAKEKNANNVIGYVKSLYFAYLTMENKGLNKVSRFEAEAKPLDPKYLLSQIENADEKIQKREEASPSTRKKITVDKSLARRIGKYVDSDVMNDRLQIKTTKKISSIKNGNKIGISKSVKSTKRK